ncbi:uncharacterized protein LOC131217667 [Magnolia sinica]|uniref:uncharacterized protein LOC131217667 n=1 Tax=Magnolia sinica TaxID=86752 RepID=UPI00265B4EFB|nr:uncharacterized protein LOC131217667 [Magnolia sinica]
MEEPVEIRTIFGGSTSGGDSNRARKTYSRKFDPEHYVHLTERPGKELRINPFSLTFTEDDALVVTMTIANHKNGVSRSCLRPVKTPLHGFAGEKVISEGAISLPVTVGEGQHQVTLMMNFLVINVPSVYNVILGRPSLNAMRVVVSTYHLMMKFPAEGGISYLLGNQHEAQRCYVIAVRKGSVKDVFAWSHADMSGISPEVLVHRLNVEPDHKPVKQKRRPFDTERYEAIAEEVSILLDVGFIEEVYYLDWIANVMYNQIAMHPLDMQKTTFVTDKGLYCYRVMPFGLKNTRATYQRLVNQMFARQIGHTMEVYVDDMLVKSIKASDHLTDLGETFGVLREYQMKLNPAKYVFGVESGKFLGFQVSQQGIETRSRCSLT